MTAGPLRLPAIIERGEKEHETLRRAREQHWYASTHFGPCLLRHGDLHALSKDARFGSPGTQILHVQGIAKGPFHDWWAKVMFNVDGETHRRLRTLVAAAFTAQGVETLRDQVRDTVDRLCSAAAGAAPAGTELDLVQALARPLPQETMWDMLGVPQADREKVTAWAADLNLCFMVFYPAVARVRLNNAVRDFYEYLRGLIAARRQAPGDDLLSLMIAARDGTDRLSEDELMAMATTLIIGGQETVWFLTTNAVSTLLHHPDQWAAVRDDPGLTAAAVEEVLRYEPPGAGLYRQALEDVDWDDLHLRTGDIIFGSAIAANRDPAEFDDPERFDITRDARGHVTFGGGPHHCLGSSIARLQAQEAVAGVARHFPGARLTAAAPAWNAPDRVFRGLVSLPLRTA
ncbi:MAG: hypothetical protein QOE92_1766 [Chloroflexota bacterium]|jgi:cytochrome P450|nr:hypothetical protein [Chloroflexota bacterium]